MRRKDREIKDPEIIESVLRRVPLLYLGMVDRHQAYIVPVNFGFLDGRLYFHSANAGRKMDILKRDPCVSFTVVDQQEVFPNGRVGCQWTNRYRSVMGTGRATIVEDESERQRGLDSVLAKYAQGPFEYAPGRFAQTAIVRIEIETLTGKQSGVGTPATARPE